MSIFETMRVSMTGLTAQRLRMDVISSNIANSETTRTAEGGPYQRRQVTFAAEPAATRFQASLLAATGERAPAVGRGVAVTRITANEAAVREVYDPRHPDANADGFVLFPDIDVVTEMTDMMAATRAYEANVTVMNSVKNMALRALSIGRS